jgi:hypothetical protein
MNASLQFSTCLESRLMESTSGRLRFAPVSHSLFQKISGQC